MLVEDKTFCEFKLNASLLIVNGSECVQVTILAGVAVGCFVSGAVALWLFLLVVCPKKHSWWVFR